MQNKTLHNRGNAVRTSIVQFVVIAIALTAFTFNTNSAFASDRRLVHHRVADGMLAVGDPTEAGLPPLTWTPATPITLAEKYAAAYVIQHQLDYRGLRAGIHVDAEATDKKQAVLDYNLLINSATAAIASLSGTNGDPVASAGYAMVLRSAANGNEKMAHRLNAQGCRNGSAAIAVSYRIAAASLAGVLHIEGEPTADANPTSAPTEPNPPATPAAPATADGGTLPPAPQ